MQIKHKGPRINNCVFVDLLALKKDRQTWKQKIKGN